MARSRGILVQTNSEMRLLTRHGDSPHSSVIDCPSSESPSEAILDALRAASRLKWDLIVAPSAGATLTASVTISGPTDVRRRFNSTNVGFAMEEHLPWSAEDFTGRLTSDGERPFGLAIRTADWEPLLNQLRGEGHVISAVIPAPLLQLYGVNELTQADTSAARLFGNEEGLHFVTTDGDRINEWRFWPGGTENAHISDPALIAAEISATTSTDSVSAFGLTNGLVDSLSNVGLETSVFDIVESSTDDLLWRGAKPFWRRRDSPPNLAVGRLAGSTPADAVVATSRFLITSLTLLLLVASGSFAWKGYQFRVMVKETQKEQIELFRATFPGATVPLAVSSRFDSQHQDIVGQRGGTEKVEFPESVLAGLKSILVAHQSPLRSRFQEIAIADDFVEIECEFRSHDDASRMVELLESSGLSVEPPQLQKLDDKRIGTRLRGRLTNVDDSGEDS